MGTLMLWSRYLIITWMKRTGRTRHPSVVVFHSCHLEVMIISIEVAWPSEVQQHTGKLTVRSHVDSNPAILSIFSWQSTHSQVHVLATTILIIANAQVICHEPFVLHLQGQSREDFFVRAAVAVGYHNIHVSTFRLTTTVWATRDDQGLKMNIV
jgi:hypothetical protein